MTDVSHLFNSLKIAILSECNTVDEYHDNYYSVILKIAKMVSINETNPHTAFFQKTVTMFPQNEYLIIFKNLLIIPKLDHLLTQLNIRFDSSFVMVYGGLVIIPAKMFSFLHKHINWWRKFRLFVYVWKRK